MQEMPSSDTKLDILPTDTVTPHQDAQGNPTLYIVRMLPGGESRSWTTRPDGTILMSPTNQFKEPSIDVVISSMELYTDKRIEHQSFDAWKNDR